MHEASAAGTLLKRWKDGTYRQLLADWKWIISFTRSCRCSVIAYTLLGILSSTLSLASGIAAKYAIDVITGFQTHRLLSMLCLMAGTGICSLILDSLMSRITARLCLRIRNHIQESIFVRILNADWLSLNAYPSGELLSRFTEDISTVSSNAVTWLPTVCIGLYRFASTLAVLVYYDSIMALIAFTSVPVLLILSRWLLRKQRQHASRVRDASAGLMRFESEAFSNTDTAKAFGAAPVFGKRLRSAQDRYTNEILAHNGFSILTNVLLSLLNMAVQFAAFGYCLYLLWNGTITFGTMTLFLQQRSTLTGTFDALLGLIPSFLNSAVSAQRLRELWELPQEACSETPDIPNNTPIHLEIQNISLGYQENCVVENVYFSAAPGQIIALVGPSGEGKTTLLRLILGLLHPKSGQALWCTDSGAMLPSDAGIRNRIAYVPQGNSLLSGSIAENLRLANETASDEAIEAALRAACAWEFVEKLPLGIHTVLGEQGRGLSEGQAQRLAIARAIVRNAPVLLLDEATSALDPDTEQQILHNIRSLCPDKLCILTTHRPSVLQICTTAYRVDKGKLFPLNPTNIHTAAPEL